MCNRVEGADVVIRTWISAGLIIGILMWQQGGRWLPTGNPAEDATLKPRADLMILYGAALVMRHSPTNLYDQQQEGVAQRAATGLDISASDPDFLPYSYPAVVALLVTPLTLLPYRVAYLLVMLLNFMLLGITLWLLTRRLKLNAPESNALVLAASAFLPIYAVFVHGQITFVLLLLYAMVITDLREGRTDRAGWLCGLTAFKPTLLPVFLLWFAVRRCWRALVWAVAVAGVLALFSILLVGVNGSAAYIAQASKLAGGQIRTAPLSAMYNLNAITHFFSAGRIALIAGTAAVLAMVVLRKPSNPTNDWDYCALICGSMLVAPYLLINELNTLLIVAAIVLTRCRGSLGIVWRWLIVVSMLLPTACFAFFGNAGAAIVAFSVLALFCIFTALSFRDSRRSSMFVASHAAPHGYA
jgi:hypothetical protein